MLGPLDVQVLINRTLDIQKIQGAALKQLEEEDEAHKQRRLQEVEEEERQVRRRNQIVEGRVDDQEKERSSGGQKGNARRRTAQSKILTSASTDDLSQSGTDPLGLKGRIIDMEV